MSRSLPRNIRLAYLLSIPGELFFPITAWLFFYLRYLDFQQITIITAIGGLSSILFEIPTGAFADIVGRKISILLSYLLFTFTMLITAYTTSFWIFLVLAILNGLVNALYSGSLEALVYDSLKETGQESVYEHVTSNLESIVWLGLCLGGITGGYMYHLWFRLPFIAQAAINFVAALITLGLIEPKIDSQKFSLSNFLSQNLLGFQELFRNRRVARWSLIFIILGSGYYIAASILGISQARQYGMDSRSVGILFSVGYFISALFSKLYPRLKHRFGIKPLLVGSSIFLITSFIFAKYVGIVVGSLLIIGRIASSTTFRNTRSLVLNRFIGSKNRATAISTMVLLCELPYVVLAYWIGKYIDLTSPNQFALALGISTILLLAFTLSIFNFTNKITPTHQQVA